MLQHGLAVRPGKPTLLAVCDGKAVIGLPGNPVSALLVARQILLPLLRHWSGAKMTQAASVHALLGANLPSASGREDTVPVRLVEREGQLLAEPVFGKSGLIFTLVGADGLLHIPPRQQRLARRHARGSATLLSALLSRNRLPWRPYRSPRRTIDCRQALRLHCRV